MKNMDFIMLISFTLLATFCCQAEGKLIVKPRDTDVKVNQSTYFNCSTDYGSTAIFWFHGKRYVYTGSAILEPYHERFQIERNVWNGTYIYNLVIHSVHPGDAGQYFCAEDEGVGEKFSIQLVVLEDDPICRSNIELDEVIGQNSCNMEPDEMELECSVTYHGNIPPQIEWKKVGENSSTPIEVSVVTSRNHFVSTLKLKGDIALNNSSYVCETKRTTQERNKCASKVIQILYALSGNSTINRTIDDEINCNGNSSQACSYKWKWLQDNDYTIESSTSVLKARKPGWHRCEAECRLRNQTCNLLVMRAMVYGDTEPSRMRTTFIPVVVAVIVTMVVVGVLIFVCLKWIFRKTDESAAGNEDERLQLGREEFGTDHLILNELLKQPVLAIYGLAVLGQEVFILRLQFQYIEVYDSITFHFKRRVEVDGMTNPESIASCSVNNCLYAFDWEYKKQPDGILLRIDPTDGKLIKTWNVNGRGGRVSIANDAHVILNINYEAKLHEYTADGELIRMIDLSLGTGIFRNWHAVKLNSGLFVVCHGGYDDPLSRVCLLSIIANTSTPGGMDDVEILKKFGGKRGKFKVPLYLSVDKEGSILVSYESHHTVLLSCNLDTPQIIVSEKHGLKKSWRTCFAESTGQWFVADHHRVMVCRVKDKQVDRKINNLITSRVIQKKV